MEAIVYKGNVFKDDRGSVSFVNDFKFTDIERFYIIENSEEHPVRAWQGHKLDCKNFYCIQGSFKIYYVKIDNWDTPSAGIKVDSIILDANTSCVLHIPAGYANAIQALEKNARLMSFSTLPLDQVKEDDIRYDKNTWRIDEL